MDGHGTTGKIATKQLLAPNQSRRLKGKLCHTQPPPLPPQCGDRQAVFQGRFVPSPLAVRKSLCLHRITYADVIDRVPSDPKLDLTSLRQGDLLGGRFRILGVINEGGLGLIYFGRDERKNEDVVIKVALKGSTPEETQKNQENITAEARALEVLGYGKKNIVDLVAIGDKDDFIVFKYIKGACFFDLNRLRPNLSKYKGDFEAYFCDTAVFTIAVLNAFKDVLEGLNALHGVGIVHGDICPGNIMFMPGENFNWQIDGVKIIDVGLGWRLESVPAGLFAGKPAYASPEQIKEGRSVDFRTDLYSLGIVLYQILQNCRPFEGYTDPKRIFSRKIKDKDPFGVPHAMVGRDEVLYIMKEDRVWERLVLDPGQKSLRIVPGYRKRLNEITDPDKRERITRLIERAEVERDEESLPHKRLTELFGDEKGNRIWNFVLKLTAFDRQDRYQSADEAREELAAILDDIHNYLPGISPRA
jgi:serine/threonine protein kinase